MADFNFGKAMSAALAPIAKTLGSVPYGALTHVTDGGGHFAKRSAYVAAIVQGGTPQEIGKAASTLAVAPLRVEVQYATATGDLAYFLGRDGNAAPWAAPLFADAKTLRADITDAQYAAAFLRNIPATSPRDICGMAAMVSMTAQRRGIVPVPLFTDPRKVGKVETWTKAHGADALARDGHAGAVFAYNAGK